MILSTIQMILIIILLFETFYFLFYRNYKKDKKIRLKRNKNELEIFFLEKEISKFQYIIDNVHHNVDISRCPICNKNYKYERFKFDKFDKDKCLESIKCPICLFKIDITYDDITYDDIILRDSDEKPSLLFSRMIRKKQLERERNYWGNKIDCIDIKINKLKEELNEN